MQWLAHDQVRARLLKEVQTTHEAARTSTGAPYQYPFASAETLLEDLKRLGEAADGSTYLDCLRCLITGLFQV